MADVIDPHARPLEPAINSHRCCRWRTLAARPNDRRSSFPSSSKCACACARMVEARLSEYPERQREHAIETLAVLVLRAWNNCIAVSSRRRSELLYRISNAKLNCRPTRCKERQLCAHISAIRSIAAPARNLPFAAVWVGASFA